MRTLRTLAAVVIVLSMLGLPVVPASARASLSDTAAEGLDILASVVDELGVAPVEGGGSSGVAVSDTTDTGLVVSLPASADGLIWMDDPYGYDLALGMPTAGGRAELYCPMDGWFRQDDQCLRRIAFGYVFAPLRYEWMDFEYDYLDYTYQERDYEYDHTPYTYDWMVPTTHEVRYPGEGECSYLPNPSAPGGLDIYCPPDIIEHEPDDPPAGWEWNDTWDSWRRLQPGPPGWEDTGEDWQRVQSPPTGWFDSGYNWQQRDPTPDGWEDYGDETQWRKRIDDPLAEGWEAFNGRWRRLVERGEGWVVLDGRWRHLAPTPENYVIDDTSWVRTVPARQRFVPDDAPVSQDTSTTPVVHPAPEGSGVMIEDDVEWEAGTEIDASSDGVIDIAAGATANVQGDGTVVYDGGSGAGSVAGQVLSDGSVRLAVTIPDETAPRSFAVPLTMPDFMAPALQDDGSVLVMALLQKDDSSTTVVEEEIWEIEYVIPVPWAKDANGTSVKTWYTLDGRTLMQTIEPTADTAWPVVADPTAKQQKQAAVAREQAKIAQDQAAIARKAREAAQEAKEKAAKKAAAAEAKLLKARTDAAQRKRLAEEAKKKAEAAKRQMQIAKEQAAAAAKAAKAAAKAAEKASAAAKKLADSNAKKLAKQAAADAQAAQKATTKAAKQKDAAQKAANDAAALKVQVDDAANVAKIVVDAYKSISTSSSQKVASTQGVLDRYAVRVNDRLLAASKGTEGKKLADAKTTEVKKVDPSMQERLASLSVTVDTGSYSANLGGNTERARMRFSFRNGSTKTSIPSFDFTALAPLAESPNIGAKIYSTKEKSLPLLGSEYGCSADYRTTAVCTTAELKPGQSFVIQFDLIANPALTDDYTNYQYASVRPELRFVFPYGLRPMLMPVNLLRNKYQVEFDDKGMVEYSGLGGEATYYSREWNSMMLEEARTLKSALRQCGFYMTERGFSDELARSMALAGVSTTLAKGLIDEAERARLILKNATQEQLVSLDAWGKAKQGIATFGKAMENFVQIADFTLDTTQLGFVSCANVVNILEAFAVRVPIIGPMSVALFEVGGANRALEAAYQEEVFTIAGSARKCVVDLRPAFGIASYGVWSNSIIRQDGYGLRCR